MYSDTLM